MEYTVAVNQAIETLGEKIEEQQDRIWQLEEQLEDAQIIAKVKGWANHGTVDDEDIALELPIPRLQIKLTQHSENHRSWFYVLVYEHTTMDIVAVPMGETVSKGSFANQIINVSNKDEVLKILPFRDGVHIRRDASHLKLPAFAIVDGKAYELEAIAPVS
ncbi:MAG: hypothetical protein AAF327_18045 [Cyanobacteria bacterium P01_A01_bin.37]